MKQLVPVTSESAYPELIGEVVVIQRFNREEWDSVELVEDSLVKFVGRLMTYVTNDKVFIFQLQGSAPSPTTIDRHDQYFEIFVLQDVEE